MSRLKKPLQTFEGDSIFSPPKIVPTTFHVVVRPAAPRKNLGSILVTSKRTRRAMQAVCTRGQLVAIGALAWKANTLDIDYSKDPVSSGFKLGDWVIFKQHAGQKQRYGEIASQDELETYDILMADTDVLALLPKEEVDRLYDWAA